MMRDVHPRIAARIAATARLLALATVAVVWCAATPPRADAIGLISGLGGPRDYGEHLLAANDDGSTGEINIVGVFGQQPLNFFGGQSSVLVNNNGNITFNGRLWTFTRSVSGRGEGR